MLHNIYSFAKRDMYICNRSYSYSCNKSYVYVENIAVPSGCTRSYTYTYMYCLTHVTLFKKINVSIHHQLHVALNQSTNFFCTRSDVHNCAIRQMYQWIRNQYVLLIYLRTFMYHVLNIFLYQELHTFMYQELHIIVPGATVFDFMYLSSIYIADTYSLVQLLIWKTQFISAFQLQNKKFDFLKSLAFPLKEKKLLKINSTEIPLNFRFIVA